ncbi:hypothetical protein [Hymenobacter sp. B1770]|uniref:hypothetical protein n=1 Tax=Hymenobacter sp. B1770 TaxID=1718788 RepID=UPI003CEAE974
MKNNLIKLCTLVLLSASVISCKKDYGVNLGPVEDSQAEIPVTVTNADAFERYPVVNTSIAAGGNITITLAIPADRGRIKQINRVATSSTTQSINLTNINAAINPGPASAPVSVFAYNATGTGTNRVVTTIPGNGSNTITFTTTLARYLTHRIAAGATAGPAGPQAGTPPAGPVTMPVPSTTAAPTDIAFYFQLELEDGRTIIPMPVRVRVLP